MAHEARTLGHGHSWDDGARRVQTVIQAACYESSVRAWIAAREGMLSSSASAAAAAAVDVSDDDAFERPAYIQYDAAPRRAEPHITRQAPDYFL